MSSSSLREIEQLFQSVVDLPRDRRQAWLDQQCGNDAALREVIESLLDQHEGGTLDILKTVDQAAALAEFPPEDRIGAYKLLKVLGEGGCGTVFLAHQEDPIRRDVALKVIKPGMDTRQVIARFEAERHTLALMDHPNVARVLDAGATDAGRPYFVMEYVPGTAINGYCDANRLDIAQRLQLFIQVCEAVQHAHQKGIIHRDIKPSNVLVEEIDGKAIPKVIDFGISKAIGDRSGRGAPHTEQGQLLGTPAYMSPEQADPSGGDIDTRSDIYSLGVLLYELLAGAYPFGDTILKRNSRFDELRQMILTLEPPKPSTRIGTSGPDSARVARCRAVDERTLIKRLRGDLDWITLKAMEKDRLRRYATVQELIADITRHLRHEPVQARAPSRIYRTSKFIRRNRAAVTGIVLVSLTLIGGLIGTTLGMAKARRSELAAQREAYKAGITAAYAGVQSQDGSLAWRSLRAAPESLRGWEWHFLTRLAGGSGLVQRLPVGPFEACVASSDGKLIATAERGGIHVWDRNSGALVTTAQFTGDDVKRIAISPDHEMMMVGGLNQTSMYSLETGNPLWTRTDGVSFRPEQFNLDPSVVLLGTSRGAKLLVVNPRDGSTLRSYTVQGGSALAPQGTLDGRRLVFSDGTDWIVVIDAESGEECWRHRGEWFHLTRDQAHVAISETGADRWTLREMETGREAFFLAHGALPESPIQGPDGRFGLVRGDRLLPFDGQRTPVAPLLCPASITLVSEIPDSNEVFALCNDGTLWKWDWNISASPFRVAPFAAKVGGASIARQGHIVATLGWGGVSVWDTRTGAQLWTRFLTRGDLTVSANRDASAVAAVTQDGKISVLNGRSGRIEHVLDASTVPMTCLEWSPTENEMFIGGSDGCLYRLRSVAGGKPERLCPVGDGVIHRLAVDPNGRIVAVAYAENKIRLIDVRTGTASAEITTGEDTTLTSLAFSPDGKSLYTCSDEPVVVRWDAKTGNRLASYEGPRAGLVAVCVHPEGSRIAAASSDTIYIWDSSSEEELLIVEGPHDVRAISFSSDGKTLLASGGDTAFMAYETGPPSCGFAARATAVRTRQIVDNIQGAEVAEDVTELLEADVTLSEEERAAAIELVRVRGDPPNTLNSRAWDIARDPRRSADEFRLGVRYVRAAMKTWPEDHGFLNTLGLLQYRLGEFEQALQTLMRADAECRKARGAPHPADTAALAMVHHRLDHVEEARAALQETRDLLKDAQLAADADNQRLYHEAEALIGKPE